MKKILNLIAPTAETVQPNEILLRYIVAIGLILATISVSHFYTNRVLGDNEVLASAINESGRQRMLSQRIQFKAVQFVRSNFSNQDLSDELASAINLFENSHENLTSLVKSNFAESELYLHYFDPAAAHLDMQSREFVTLSKDILNALTTNTANPLRNMELFDAEQLLVDLNTAVGGFESLSNSAVKKAKTHADQSYWVAVAILIFEFLIIFLPAHFVIRDVLRRRNEIPS